MVTQPPKERLLPVIVLSIVLAALYTVGLVQPSALNWGFNALGFLPRQFFVLYLVALSAVVIYVTKGNIENIVASLARFMDKNPLRFFLISAAVVISAAIVFRVRIPLLGDGFYLVKNYSEAFRGIAPLYPRDEPLATYYFSAVLNVIGIPTYDQFLRAFLIAEIILAVGFMVNLFMIVRTTVADPRSRLFVFMILLVMPYMQLFFGYIEIYAVVLLALSLWVNISVLYLYKKIPFYIIPCTFLLMALTHYLTLLTVPSLLFLTFLEFRRNGIRRIIAGFGIAIAVMLLLLMMIQFNVEQYTSQVPYSHILSFSISSDALENYAQAYTMFSVYHAVDLLNILVLLCPFLIILLIMMSKRFVASVVAHPLGQFLLFAIMPIILFLCVVKFDLGAARDWDVFSSYVFILMLFGAHMVVSENRILPVKTLSLVILLSLIHSSLYWYMNSTTDASLKRYESLFDARTLSQNGFYGASLQLSMYYHQVNNSHEPIILWEKYAARFPNDERGATNIINNLNEGADDTTILRTYKQWYANNPKDTTSNNDFLRFTLNAGKRFFDSGKFSEAEQCFREATALDSFYSKPFNNLGSVLAVRGKLGDAITMFEKAVALDSTYGDALYNLGSAHIDIGNKKLGIVYLQRAARSENISAQRELQRQKIAW